MNILIFFTILSTNSSEQEIYLYFSDQILLNFESFSCCIKVTFHLHFLLSLAKFWWSYRRLRHWKGHFLFNPFILIGICRDACLPILAGTFTDGTYDAPHFHKFPSHLGDLSYISLSPSRARTYSGTSFLCVFDHEHLCETICCPNLPRHPISTSQKWKMRAMK